jgi:MFS family permease
MTLVVNDDGGGPGSVRLASAAGRWVLAVAVLGEAMVLLEATVVNVALPAIGRDLGAGVAGLQWTLNGYVLTLAALILPAGSLSDLYGRRRVFAVGVGALWQPPRCAPPPRQFSCSSRPGLFKALAVPC